MGPADSGHDSALNCHGGAGNQAGTTAKTETEKSGNGAHVCFAIFQLLNLNVVQRIFN